MCSQGYEYYKLRDCERFGYGKDEGRNPKADNQVVISNGDQGVSLTIANLEVWDGK